MRREKAGTTPYAQDDGSGGAPEAPDASREATPRTLRPRRETGNTPEGNIRFIEAEDKSFGQSSDGRPTPAAPATDKRGAISFLPSGKTLIQLFDNADLSTVLHETGHLFLEVMGDLATAENAPAALKAEYAKAPPLTRGSTPQAPRSRASTAGKPFRVQLSCPLDHRWRQMQRGRSAPEAMCT